MTDEEIFAILRTVIMTVTGVPECILGDQPAGAPSGEYAAVRCKQSITQRGAPFRIRTTSATPQSVDDKIKRQIIATCSVNFYRGDALDRAERLKGCNFRSDISAILYKASLGWFGTDNVNNLTSLQSSRMEQRAQINIRLAYETIDEYTINSIEKIPYSIEDANGNILAEDV